MLDTRKVHRGGVLDVTLDAHQVCMRVLNTMLDTRQVHKGMFNDTVFNIMLDTRQVHRGMFNSRHA
jgi:hypothetical protein